MFMPLPDLILFVAVLILGLVLVRLAWLLRKSSKPEQKPSKPLVLGLSVLAIVLSLFLIAREIQGMAPYQYDPTVDEALGRTLAVLFLPEGVKGDVVIISQGIPEDEPKYENRIAKARLEALLEQMAARGMAEPELVSPLRVLRKVKDGGAEWYVDDYWMMDSGLPGSVLSYVWKQYPKAAVVISLEGSPRHELESLKAEKPDGSLFYALDLIDYEFAGSERNLPPLDGVVIYHPNPDWENRSDNDEELFNSRFVFVKP